MLTLTNNIIVSHSVGISVTAGSTATIEGTLWGSGEWANDIDIVNVGGSISLGAVNLHAEPGFVDPESGNYHITPASAAVDAGVATALASDIDGEARPFGAGPDIGADEWATVEQLVQPGSSASVTMTVRGLDTTFAVPSGAVTQTTLLRFTALAEPPHASPPGTSSARVAFSAEALVDGLPVPGFSFSQPVQVTSHYPVPLYGIQAPALLLYYWTSTAWEDAACGGYMRNLAEHWLSLPICHLSDFGLFGSGLQLNLPLACK